MQGTMSQILYLSFSFNFISKRLTLSDFLKHFLSTLHRMKTESKSEIRDIVPSIIPCRTHK